MLKGIREAHIVHKRGIETLNMGIRVVELGKGIHDGDDIGKCEGIGGSSF